MRIGAQRQPEMPKVLGEIIGLRHRPQRRHVDQLVVLGAFGARQQLVQMRRLQHLPLGQNQTRGSGDFAQCFQLFGAGLFVDTEQQWGFLGDQSFGRRDIRQHHEFFNQPVRIQPFFVLNRRHLSCVTQHDLALW